MKQIELGYSEKQKIMIMIGYEAIADPVVSMERRMDLIFFLINVIGISKLKTLWEGTITINGKEEQKYDHYMKYLKKRRDDIAEVLAYWIGVNNKKIDPENMKSERFKRYMNSFNQLPMNPKLDYIRNSLLNAIDLEGMSIPNELITEVRRQRLYGKDSQTSNAIKEQMQAEQG